MGSLSPRSQWSSVALLFALMATSVAAETAQETLVNGVPHVRNSAEPQEGRLNVTLEPLWSVGGDDQDAVLLGVINRALVQPDGTIYLLDTQLSQVQVFASNGRHLRTFGREGSGPGEMRQPIDMAFLPDGTLGLVQEFPGKIIKLNLDGTPAGTFTPGATGKMVGGFLALRFCRHASGNLVLGGRVMTMNPNTPTQSQTFFLRSYDMAAGLRAGYLLEERALDMRSGLLNEIDYDFVWNRAALAADGKLFVCEPRYGYRVTVFQPDGTVERVFGRPYESWRRTERARVRVERIFARLAQHMPGETKIRVESREADIVDLFVHADGNIWCQTSRAMWEPPESAFTVYDVFDPAGAFIRQVTVHCPGDATRDRLIFAGEDRVFLITGYWDAVLNAQGEPGDAGEAAPMTVTCCLIP